MNCGSTISLTDFLLVIGCSTYNNNYGILTMMRRTDLEEILAFTGGSNTTSMIGGGIAILKKN